MGVRAPLAPLVTRPTDCPAGPVCGNSRTGCSPLTPSSHAVLASLDMGSETGKAQLGARFAKLWLASTASALGVGLATVATPLLIASRTSEPAGHLGRAGRRLAALAAVRAARRGAGGPGRPAPADDLDRLGPGGADGAARRRHRRGPRGHRAHLHRVVPGEHRRSGVPLGEPGDDPGGGAARGAGAGQRLADRRRHGDAEHDRRAAGRRAVRGRREHSVLGQLGHLRRQRGADHGGHRHVSHHAARSGRGRRDGRRDRHRHRNRHRRRTRCRPIRRPNPSGSAPSGPRWPRASAG